jgi:hypothetical protein
MVVYIDTQLGGLNTEIERFITKYKFKTCWESFPPGEIAKCMMIILILDNRMHFSHDYIEECIKKLKNQNNNPVISLVNRYDPHLIEFLYKNHKIFPFTLQEIEKVIMFESAFFNGLEDLEGQYEDDIEEDEQEYRPFYADLISETLDRWIIIN